MKPAMQIRLGQHLTLTPQLQQAIRLLQLSTIDLAQEIQQTLESNPMLEMDLNSEEEYLTNEQEQQETNNMEDCIPEELALDTQWSDLYQHGNRKSNETNDFNLEQIYGTRDDLHTHLSWQLELTTLSDMDQAIATSIIEAINEQGLLTISLEEIQKSIALPEPPGLDEITAVLHLIQQFDPMGVGARSIEECLQIQLQQLTEDTPWREQALALIREYSALLAKRDFKSLQRCMKLSNKDFQSCMKLIQSLNPHPGEAIAARTTDYITPDVIVRKHKDRWHIFLNTGRLPKLQINTYYAKLTKMTKTPKDKHYLRNQLQQAKWFLKSIQSRNDTLLRVATCIVNTQSEFLEHGAESMKPLILNNIANELNLHESTISRISRQKYMLTPHGTFELKYFFSSHVSTKNGGECSATAIRALIKKLVAHENVEKPLSDNKIAELLKKQGIKIARRTVAKYREGMAILPSHERKQIGTVDF